MPQIYQHYKGGNYEFVTDGFFESNLEKCVVYKSLSDSADFPAGTVWVRPEAEFFGSVLVNGINTPRFSQIWNSTSLRFFPT